MSEHLPTKEPFTGHNFSHLTHPELYEEVSEGSGWFALSPKRIVAELDRLSLVINKQATVMTEFSESVLSLTAERDRLTGLVREMYHAFLAPYPFAEEGAEKQDRWAIRRADALDEARAALKEQP